MKKFAKILAVALAVAAITPVTAQGLSAEERQEGLEKLREFKHNILAKELTLTKDQKDKFFSVYDAMDNELMAVGEETREAERKVGTDTKASEQDLRDHARTLFEQKKKEGDIELRYFDKFAEVLTAQQLARMKPAERKITLALARYHGRQRQAKK